MHDNDGWQLRRRIFFVISGTIRQDLTSLIKKRKKQLVYREEKRHSGKDKNIRQSGDPYPISQTDELHKI